MVKDKMMWSPERPRLSRQTEAGRPPGMFIAALAACALIGCDEVFVEPAPPPLAQSAELASGAALLQVDVVERILTLRWGDEVRARVELDRLRLGRVASFNPARNYAPDSLKSAPVDDLVWLYAWHGRHHVAHITSLREKMGW